MEAQVWTLIGLLGATVLGSFVYLGQKIDGQGARLDGLGQKIDAEGARIDSMSGRIDGLSTRIDGLSARIDGLSARVEDHGRDLGNRIYELAGKLDEHLRRHAV